MNAKIINFFYLLMKDHLTISVVEKLVRESDQINESTEYSDEYLYKMAEEKFNRLFSDKINGVDFLKIIDFKYCPVTNKKVNLTKISDTNLVYRSESFNNSNFIEVCKSFLPKMMDGFGIKGVKNNVCFLSYFKINSNNEICSDEFNDDGKPVIQIDTNKCEFSDFSLPYRVKYRDTFLKKEIKEKFSSVKEFWDYLDNLEEFKINDQDRTTQS